MFGVVWYRSRLKSFRVVRSLSESSGVVRIRSELPGVTKSRPESFEVIVVQSRSKSVGTNKRCQVQCACDQTFHTVVFFCLSLCACTSYTGLVSKAGYGRLRTTPDDSERLRFRTTPNDSGFLPTLLITNEDRGGAHKTKLTSSMYSFPRPLLSFSLPAVPGGRRPSRG